MLVSTRHANSTHSGPPVLDMLLEGFIWVSFQDKQVSLFEPTRATQGKSSQKLLHSEKQSYVIKSARCSRACNERFKMNKTKQNMGKRQRLQNYMLWGKNLYFDIQEAPAVLLKSDFHFSLSCIGEGNGNPHQCSCLENPRDSRAWWAAVYGVTQSWTRLKQLSSSSSSSCTFSVFF